MKALILLFFCSAITIDVFAQRRTIDISNFSEFSLAVAGNVYLRQGSDEKIEVECSDDIFDRLEFEKSGDRLIIRREGKWNWRDGFRNSDLDVYLTMKDIERLSISSSGSITGQNQIDSREIQLSISGSGNMELDLNSSEVNMSISGSGDIELGGSSDLTKARISGSGKVRAEDMEARIFEATISGSGNCYITVSEEVTARISGSGNVYYNGDPERVISNSSGSGKIKRL